MTGRRRYALVWFGVATAGAVLMLAAAAVLTSAHGRTTAPAVAGTTAVTIGDDWFCDDGHGGAVCSVSLAAGGVVSWSYAAGSSVHTVTDCGASCDDPAPSPAFDSGLLFPGDTFAHVFAGPGTYRYFCTVHPAEMRGEVVVTAAETGTPTPTAAAGTETPTPTAEASPTDMPPSTPTAEPEASPTPSTTAAPGTPAATVTPTAAGAASATPAVTPGASPTAAPLSTPPAAPTTGNRPPSGPTAPAPMPEDTPGSASRSLPRSGAEGALEAGPPARPAHLSGPPPWTEAPQEPAARSLGGAKEPTPIVDYALGLGMGGLGLLLLGLGLARATR